MKLINLTPHEIRIRTTADPADDLVIPPEPRSARVVTDADEAASLRVDGHTIPVRSHRYGGVDGLPEPHSGVAYLVSLIVLDA